MSQATLTTEQFATMAANLLHRALIESPRTTAKRIFREIHAGGRVAVANVKMEDGGEVRVDVVLDHSECRGDLNFSRFRETFVALMRDLASQIESEEPLQTFSAQVAEGSEGQFVSDEKLFAARGVSQHNGELNILMLAAKPEPADPVVTMRLLYVSPDQFISSSPSS